MPPRAAVSQASLSFTISIISRSLPKGRRRGNNDFNRNHDFLLHVKQSRSCVFVNALLFGYTLEGIDLCAENTMVNPVFQSERDGK